MKTNGDKLRAADIVDELNSLIPGLEYSRETHVLWRDCDQSHRDLNPAAGDLNHHIQCIAEYDQRIMIIKEAASQITQLEKDKADLSKMLQRLIDDFDGAYMNGIQYNSLHDSIELLANHKGDK